MSSSTYSSSITYGPSYRQSGACPGCSIPLPLFAERWRNPYELAYFVIAVISFVITLFALAGNVVAGRRVSGGVTGRGLFLAAIITTFLLYLTTIIGIAIPQDGAHVNRSFYAVSAIQSIFNYFSNLLIFLTIAKIAGFNRIAFIVFTVLLTLLALAISALAILHAYELINPLYYTYSYNGHTYTELAGSYTYEYSPILLLIECVMDGLAMLGLLAILRPMLRRARENTSTHNLFLRSTWAVFFLALALDIAYNAIFISLDFDTLVNALIFAYIGVDLNTFLTALTLVFILLVYLKWGGNTTNTDFSHPGDYSTYAPAPKSGRKSRWHLGMARKNAPAQSSIV